MFHESTVEVEVSAAIAVFLVTGSVSIVVLVRVRPVRVVLSMEPVAAFVGTPHYSGRFK